MEHSRISSKWNPTLFAKCEDGAGTVMALFMLVIVFIVGGIAVDFTNLWRNQQVLQQTADVSSHAGVVGIANGAGEAAIQSLAVDAIQFNMETSRWGKVLEDAATDVTFLNYDPVTNTVSSAGKINAVQVTLQRSKAVNNPVNTFLLKMANFTSGSIADLSSFDVVVSSVSAFAETQRCVSSDIIYTKGEMQITSSNTFGRGFCLHSQSEVWMPQQNSFMSDTGISMPNLASCGDKCTDEANPGSSDAAFASNMIIEDIASLLNETLDAFSGSQLDSELRSEFFSTKSLDADLTALSEVGISTSMLQKGSEVPMDQGTFESLSRIPEGLVYSVACNANGNGPNTWLKFDSSNGGNDVRDVAIITSCGIDFGSSANIEGSLLLSTKTSTTATVTASSGSSIGTNTSTCSDEKKSYIMATGDVKVPADFVGSNIAVIVDGAVHLSASSSSNTIDHVGASILASGDVHISANHTFGSCASPPSGLMPELLVIRHVVPS